MKPKILITSVIAILIIAGFFLYPLFDEKDLVEKISDRKYIEKLRNNPSSEKITIEDKTFEKEYDPIKKNVKISKEDEILLDIRLISPYTVSGLIASSSTKVAEFLLIDWGEDRNNLFEEVKYFDVGNEYSEVDRTFKYKYGTNQENCEEECFTYTTWTDFNTLDELPNKNIKIGAFTNTYRGESVEWIPKIDGFEILEWARWDISTAVDNGQNLSISPQETTVQGVAWMTNGSKMYIVGTIADKVFEYDCSTAFNVSTCVYNNNFISTLSQDSTRGLWFRADGTLMVLAGDSSTPQGISVFTLSTAWDITSATEIADDCVIGGSELTDVWVTPNGTLFLVAQASANTINMFTLSTAWDFSTCSSAGSFNPAEMTAIDDVEFKRTDGFSMWLLNRTSDEIFKYTLSEQYNVTTAVYDGTSFAPGVDSAMLGFALKENGGAMYFAGATNDSIYQYDMPVAMATLNIPLNKTNLTLDNQVEFNCTGTAISGTISNISFYLDGIKNTSINGTTASEELITTINVGEGHHNWTCIATDSANNFEWAVNRTFSMDAEAPIMNITQPFESVTYHKLNTNITINWSVSDISLGNCVGSFDNGTTNISLTCADNNITVNITHMNNNSFMFFANDSFGNGRITSRVWNYKIFQTDVSFSASTREGAIETFLLNFTQNTSLQTSNINLIYNSTSSSSAFSISSNNVSSNKSLTILNQDAILSIPFYWNIIMSNGEEINTTTYNQTVDTFIVDNCSKLTTVLYNYTVYDEETQVKISNTTIETQFQLFDSSGTTNILNFSEIVNNTNPTQICMNGSLSTDINYSVTSVIKYSANDTENNKTYAIEYYNILNGILSNATIPNNIALYDLNNEDSTEFQLTVRDSSFGLASNVLINLFRQYVSDNDFKVVEIPLTDSSGQTILHLVRNNVVYNIVIVDGEGNVIDTFNRIIAFCQDFTIGQCTIRLNARGGEDDIYNYQSNLGISYSKPTFSNSTGLVSFNFVSDDLTSKTVKINVIRESAFGNRSVCSNTLTSSTGTVTCDVSSVSATDRFLFIEVLVGGNFMIQETIDLEGEDFNYGVVNGAFFAFLLLLFMITLFMEDKQILVLSLGVGWAVVISLGLISGSLVGGLSGGIWLIVCIMIFMWKLNNERRP